MRYPEEPLFDHGVPERLGVLLVNLGTPDSPTPADVRRYLAEFLSDPRVIEMPRLLWRIILHGVILRIRPKRSARLYARIWTQEGSPLLSISRRQAEALQMSLSERTAGKIQVELAMRYGNPSLDTALENLRRHNLSRLLVLPLYPQYSATTTASTFDAVTRTMRRWRRLPEIRFISHYHDDPGYIAVLAGKIQSFWETHGVPDRLLFSFHGIPKEYFMAGDPYFCECLKTARLVAESLALDADSWRASFQSRVGNKEWLKPYTDHQLQEWADKGVRKVHVVCPGFPADCLETLEEIAMENRELFLAAGGGQFDYIPALNDDPDHIRVLSDLVMRHACGWPEAESGRDAPSANQEILARRERALARGADR